MDNDASFVVTLWPLVLAAPMLGAVASFVWPRRGRLVGLVALIVAAFGALDLVRIVQLDGEMNHLVGGWEAPLGIRLFADGLSALMVLMTALVGTGISVYAPAYFGTTGAAGRHQERYFWPLWLFLVTGLMALFLTADLFNAYVAIELISFSSVALVALADQRESLVAAIRYLLVGLLGSLSYLLGVALLYGAHGTVDRALLAETMNGGGIDQFAIVVMLGGLLLKGAIFPLHFWLPPAHSTAPAPASAALSALVVKGAFYLILRLWFELAEGWISSRIAFALGAMGCGAVVWGCVQALRQARLKLLVAYSTVAQLGYLFLLFPLMAAGAGPGAWAGGIYFAISHAFAKTAIFMAAGNVMHAAGHDRLKDLVGVAQVMPVTFLALALAGLNAVGLPPSGAFIGKWLLLTHSLESRQWALVIVIGFGGLMAAGYTVRILNLALLRPHQTGAGQHFHRLPAVMEWTPLVLALVSLILGLVVKLPMQVLEEGAPFGIERLAEGKP